MHGNGGDAKKRILIMTGAAALALVVLILCAVGIRSCSRGNKYDKYFEQASAACDTGDWENAKELLLRALEYDRTEEAYLLLSNVYAYGMDDIDSALETLYIGYSLLGGEKLSARIEELKAAKRGEAEAEDSVTIAGNDYALDLTALSLSGQELTDSDIEVLSRFERLDGLTLSNNRITSVAALSSLNTLVTLDLSNNEISNLNPLKTLSNLRTLYLDGNPIENFTPLYSMTGLRTLSIRDIELTESELEELKKALPDCDIFCDDTIEEVEEITLGGVTFRSDVEELDLSGLGITDITELAKCEQLKKLDLRDNSISSLTPLAGLTGLEWLCVWNNRVSDLSPLAGLTGLYYLDLDDNSVTSISALSGLTGLKELWLDGNSIADLSPLKKLSRLERLGLGSTGIGDDGLKNLESLACLTELKLTGNDALTGNAVDALREKLTGCTITTSELLYTVTFGGTEYKSDAASITAKGASVTSIKGLEKFTKLTYLELSNNSISDISALKGLSSLEYFAADFNSIVDISALSGHTALKTLHLMGNSISGLSALSGCTGLTELKLSQNYGLGDVSALKGLTGLKTLALDYCGLSDITALSGLTGLKELNLEGNSISDVTALFSLTGLESLRLINNDLTPEQIEALKQALPDCRIEADEFPEQTAPAD